MDASVRNLLPSPAVRLRPMSAANVSCAGEAEQRQIIVFLGHDASYSCIALLQELTKTCGGRVAAWAPYISTEGEATYANFRLALTTLRRAGIGVTYSATATSVSANTIAAFDFWVHHRDILSATTSSDDLDCRSGRRTSEPFFGYSRVSVAYAAIFPRVVDPYKADWGEWTFDTAIWKMRKHLALKHHCATAWVAMSECDLPSWLDGAMPGIWDEYLEADPDYSAIVRRERSEGNSDCNDLDRAYRVCRRRYLESAAGRLHLWTVRFCGRGERERVQTKAWA
jgi:hypothetical protein